MCLIVKRSKFNKFIERKLKILLIPRPKKARKDIKVFKVLELNGLFLHSIYYGKDRCWAVNWIYKNSIKGIVSFKNKEIHTIEVSEGFHSYVEFHNIILIHKDYVVCEAIIPKGSKYYLGTEGDIVSNQLKITKILN